MTAMWNGIIQISARYIIFPYTTVEEANIKVQYAAKASFQNVVRPIHCTHIAIKAPSQDAFVLWAAVLHYMSTLISDHYVCSVHCSELTAFTTLHTLIHSLLFL